MQTELFDKLENYKDMIRVFRRVEAKEVRSFIETYHYSKNINGVKINHCFAIFLDAKLVGAMLFGSLSTTAWKKYGSCESDVIELRRLVTLDSCPKNTESWFISKALKWLKKNTDFKVCVSYADPFYEHVGYVYQATNWNYEGMTPKDIAYLTPDGKQYHSRALRTKYKGDYKPFVKKLRQMKKNGELKEIELPGKHIYTYNLKKHKAVRIEYPKYKNTKGIK